MSAHRLTVVYADDDDLHRETISELLTHHGIDVHACSDGAEVIPLCEQMNPDSVLLDLNMPGVDGLKVARQLRRDSGDKSLRLVALTGHGTWELRKKAIDAGFDEFLTKPVPADVLIGALRPVSSGR
ncbi:MAG TPA: response regulator [Rhodanobacteraceae bacterium]|nr:response regulator [Rhodanobacteraceae bacterium]